MKEKEEVLFRGKAKDEYQYPYYIIKGGEWVKGYFVKGINGCGIITKDNNSLVVGEQNVIRVDCETVGLCVTLNGIEICKGDIVVCSIDGFPIIGKVLWSGAGFWLVPIIVPESSGIDTATHYGVPLNGVKVIGNIYDGVTLLEGGNNEKD